MSVKKVRNYIFCVGLTLLLLPEAYCQQNEFDSLKTLIKKSSHDTTRAKLLAVLAELYASEPDTAIQIARQTIGIVEKNIPGANQKELHSYLKSKSAAVNVMGYISNENGDTAAGRKFFNESLKIQEENRDKEGAALSLTNLGAICLKQGDLKNALHYYEKSLILSEEIGDKEGIAYCLDILGKTYLNHGNIPKALDYHHKGLKIQEETGDKKGIARSLINIGSIYNNQGDTAMALKNYLKSLKISEKIGDKRGIAQCLNNIGAVLKYQGQISKALDYYSKSLKIDQEIGNKNGMATALNNIGVIYGQRGEFDLALNYYDRSLKIQREISDVRGLASSLNNIGGVYMLYAIREISEKKINKGKRKLILAYSYSDSSLVLSKKLGFPEVIRNAQKILARIDSAKGNYEGAFEHYKQLIILRDSISNNETRKASLKSQLKYEYEKKEAVVKEQQEKERAVTLEKDRFHKIVIWSVVSGLLLMIVFAGFVLKTLKVTRKQKVIIEEKQKEILDSIHYAKRIQKSLLPTEIYINKSLTNLKK